MATRVTFVVSNPVLSLNDMKKRVWGCPGEEAVSPNSLSCFPESMWAVARLTVVLTCWPGSDQ